MVKEMSVHELIWVLQPSLTSYTLRRSQTCLRVFGECCLDQLSYLHLLP